MAEKYITKPTIVEAVKWTGKNTEDIKTFCNNDSIIFENTETIGVFNLFIKTLEGVMKAKHGDYIIKGTLGEFYPCNPQAFKNKYEEYK